MKLSKTKAVLVIAGAILATLSNVQLANAQQGTITEAYAGCSTKSAYYELITAVNKIDRAQINALLGNGECLFLEGLKYSVVDRGFVSSKIRVYGNGGSAVVWVPSEAIK